MSEHQFADHFSLFTETAQWALGSDVTDAVFTVPFEFSHSQEQALRCAIVLLANEMCNLIGFLPLYFFFSVCLFVQGCGRSCRLPSVEADPRAGRRSVGLQHWTRVFFRKEVRAADYIYISSSLQQFHMFGRCRPNMRGQGRVTSNQSWRNKFSFPLHIRCFLKSLIFNLVYIFFFLLDSLQ